MKFTTQTETNLPGPFYVTAIEDGGARVFRLAGPYDTHADAEARVEHVRGIACDFSKNSNAGRAAFMAYGVSRATDGQRQTTALGAI